MLCTGKTNERKGVGVIINKTMKIKLVEVTKKINYSS